MAVKPSPTLATRIRELGTLADFADKLDEPVDSVSDTFLHPPEHHLHIIIELPSVGGSSSLLSHLAHVPSRSTRRLRRLIWLTIMSSSFLSHFNVFDPS